jgi:FkbM family methyltransferase
MRTRRIEMVFFSRVASLIPTGVPVPIMKGPLRGKLWISGAAAGAGKGLSPVLNRAEPKQLEMARQWIGGGGICFDIGANVGLYTVLFSRYARFVYSFEPVPRNIRFLHRTVEINKCRNVTIVPLAVGDKLSMNSFSVESNFAIGRVDINGMQPVACTDIDSFCDKYKLFPDIIKIDVEGFEEEVIHGGRRILRERHPKLLLSLHSFDLCRRCVLALKGIGYRNFIVLKGKGNSIERASQLAVF